MIDSKEASIFMPRNRKCFRAFLPITINEMLSPWASAAAIERSARRMTLLL